MQNPSFTATFENCAYQFLFSYDVDTKQVDVTGFDLVNDDTRIVQHFGMALEVVTTLMFSPLARAEFFNA